MEKGFPILHRIRDIWAHHKLAVLALLVVITVAGIFGARSVSQMIYWSNPAKLDQPLQGWMTPRYVGRSYDVPPEVVQQAFGLEKPSIPRRMSLDAIAAEQGMSMAELQASLDAAVTAWRETGGK
jgi:hypothetical protein